MICHHRNAKKQEMSFGTTAIMQMQIIGSRGKKAEKMKEGEGDFFCTKSQRHLGHRAPQMITLAHARFCTLAKSATLQMTIVLSGFGGHSRKHGLSLGPLERPFEALLEIPKILKFQK